MVFAEKADLRKGDWNPKRKLGVATIIRKSFKIRNNVWCVVVVVLFLFLFSFAFICFVFSKLKVIISKISVVTPNFVSGFQQPLLRTPFPAYL